MPDVDGIELLKHVRSDEAFNSMPVVSRPLLLIRCSRYAALSKQLVLTSFGLPAVMSANEHTETVFECIRRGAEDYLLKPVTKKEVQYICQHVWRRQKHGALNVQLLGADEVGSQRHSYPPIREKVYLYSLRWTLLQAEDVMQIEPESSSQQYGPVPSRSRESRHHSRERWRVEEQERPLPPPAAAAQEAAATLLSDRLRSGAHASSSGRLVAANGPAANGATANGVATHGEAVNGFAAPTRASPGSAAGGQQIAGTQELTQGARLPLSVYFAQRKTVVNSSDSFRIFCAAVALLQVLHNPSAATRLERVQTCFSISLSPRNLSSR